MKCLQKYVNVEKKEDINQVCSSAVSKTTVGVERADYGE